MKKLIAVQGPENCGKTSCITLARDELKSIFGIADENIDMNPLNFDRRNGDFVCVISIGGKKVGIESRGDVKAVGELVKSLKYFAQTDCIVIVCPTQKTARSQTVREVNDFASRNQYALEPIEKTRSEPGLQETDNQKVAERIVNAIRTTLEL